MRMPMCITHAVTLSICTLSHKQIKQGQMNEPLPLAGPPQKDPKTGSLNPRPRPQSRPCLAETPDP